MYRFLVGICIDPFKGQYGANLGGSICRTVDRFGIDMDGVARTNADGGSRETTYVMEALSGLSASELSDKAKDLNTRLEQLDREEAVQVARARSLGLVDREPKAVVKLQNPVNDSLEKESTEG